MRTKIKMVLTVVATIFILMLVILNNQIKVSAYETLDATIDKNGDVLVAGSHNIMAPEEGELGLELSFSESVFGPVVNCEGYVMVEFTWKDDGGTEQLSQNPCWLLEVSKINIVISQDSVIFYGIDEEGGDLSVYRPYQRDVLSVYINFFIPISSKPGVSGTEVIYNNIDNPYTLEEVAIAAGILVHDSYYGDITDLLVIENDGYSEFKKIPGEYKILYSATNPSGLTAYFLLTIINKDLTAPLVVGPESSQISYRTQLTNEDIVSLYEVSDNYDQNVRLVVEETNYRVYKVGVFTFKLSATDGFFNTTTIIHTVEVIDDISPIFIDPLSGVIRVSYDQKYHEEDFVLGLTAHDEIDGDLTSEITIKESNFVNGKIGNYYVIFTITDSAGNVGEHTRNYEVVTTQVPIFYVSKEVIYVKEGYELTIDQIAKEMADYANIIMVKYEIVESEYDSNQIKEGQYKMVIKITDPSNKESYHSFVLEVLSSEYEKPDEPWYQFIINIGKWIYNNIIRHIINFFLIIWNHTVGIIIKTARLEYLTRL